MPQIRVLVMINGKAKVFMVIMEVLIITIVLEIIIIVHEKIIHLLL